MKLTSGEIDKIYLYAKNNMGLVLKKYDKEKIEYFIENRLMELKLNSAEEYFDYLTFSKNSAFEYNLLSCCLCVNETSFFRNSEVYNLLRNKLIKEIIENNSSEYVRILSAGCSVGAEAYSIAIVFDDYIKRNNLNKKVRILGIDIDKEALATAERGIYNYRTLFLNEFDSNIISQYFDSKNKDNFCVSDDIKKMVTFKYLNLLNSEFPVEFDLIFIKNVMIYFNDEKNDMLIKKMYRMLKNRGVLVTTTTEFQLDYEELFDIEKYNSIYYYKKWTTCKRKSKATQKTDEDKRTPVIIKSVPKSEYIISETEVLTKFDGVISYNIDEKTFKNNILMPLYYISSKIIIYDFSGIKFIDNLCLRYISEILPKNINSVSKESVYFIVNSKNENDFFKAKLNRYVKIINDKSEINYKKIKNKLSGSDSSDKLEIKTIPDKNISKYGITTKYKNHQKLEIFLKKESNDAGKSDVYGNNKLLSDFSRINNRTEKPNNENKIINSVLTKKTNHDLNAENILIGTGSVKRSNYLLLDKIYNDENEIKLFKKQLINLLNFGFSEIRVDAKELEYMDSLCADFLKRFIDLCASYKIKLKIFNAKKTVEDFLTRKNIPENIFY